MLVSPTDGGQTVTVTPAVGEGNARRYIITAAANQPYLSTSVNAELSAGWNAFPADGVVHGTAGDIITVVDVFAGSGGMRAAGTATLPQPGAKATLNP